MDYNVKKKIKDDSEPDQVTYIQTDAYIDLSNKFTIDSDVSAVVLKNITEKNNLTNSEKEKLQSYLEVFKNSADKETTI